MRNYNKEIRELEIKRDKLNREIYKLEKERNYEIYKMVGSLRASLELATSDYEKIKEDGRAFLLESAKEIIENRKKVF